MNRKISWKKIDNFKTEVYLLGENKNRPIGIIELTNNFKYVVKPNFTILLVDRHIVHKKYVDTIEAGRKLVELWEIMKNVSVVDTEEFFVGDLFSAAD